MTPNLDLTSIPGGDLIAKGLDDLKRGKQSEEALAVLVAGRRLSALGFRVPRRKSIPLPYEHTLFAAIERRDPSGAHATYNALLQRIVSFLDAFWIASRAR